jgi:rubredoxin
MNTLPQALFDDPRPICRACGTQFSAAPPPEVCPICADERQAVPDDGQAWTTLAALATTHQNVFTAHEPGLTSIRTAPRFAIGQQAYLVETPAGNVLWDCVSLVDRASVEAVRARGPVVAVAISHPHFYSSMVSWAHALETPVWLHEADRRWVNRPDPALRFWQGSTHRMLDGVTLVHVPGHFEGSTVLHWAQGAQGRGVLLAGDQPNVCDDRRWVTFMRSYPNFLPLSPAQVQGVTDALRPWPYERLYGWAPGRVVPSQAHARVEASAQRYLHAVR